MHRRYHLQVKLADQNVVAIDGSDLKRAKKDILMLAADFVQTYPLAGDMSDECFQVIDEAGRLILELPVPLVLREAARRRPTDLPASD